MFGNKLKKANTNLDIIKDIEEKFSALQSSTPIGELKGKLEEDKLKVERMKIARDAVEFAISEQDLRRKEETKQAEHDLALTKITSEKNAYKKTVWTIKYCQSIIKTTIIIIISFVCFRLVCTNYTDELIADLKNEQITNRAILNEIRNIKK